MRARDSVVHVCNPDTQKPEARKQSSGWGKFHSESRAFFTNQESVIPAQAAWELNPHSGLLKRLGQCWPLSFALS